MTKTF